MLDKNATGTSFRWASYSTGLLVIPNPGAPMIVTPQTKHTIDQILSIFETGRLISPSAYSACTILKDGAGISYGKHQSTDRSGSLDQIVLAYIDAHGIHGEALRAYLPLLARDGTRVDPANPPAEVKALMDLLKKAGTDPIMQRVQDEVFDEGYWNPAVKAGDAMLLTYPLSYAILYDTCIHSGVGGVANIRKRFPEVPPARGGDEKAWAAAYVKARKAWLLSSSNPIVRKTIYRMEAFEKIIADDNWTLDTPLTIRKVTIPRAEPKLV